MFKTFREMYKPTFKNTLNSLGLMVITVGTMFVLLNVVDILSLGVMNRL